MAEDTGALPDLQTIARLLGGVVNNDDQVLAPGPGHSPLDQSLSIKISTGVPDGFLVNSFAGDDPIVCRDYVREKLGLPAFQPNGRQRLSGDEITRAVMAAAMGQGRGHSKGKIIATYDYTDASGALLYQVLRYKPKDFRQRRPDGSGGWIWKLDESRVVYRWPELLKYPDATVFITEGEKDADRVAELDLCATTVATGKWTEDCIKTLAGRDIVILQDNDDVGHKKAIEAATALHGIANNIRIVALPDLPDRGDVSDWLDADRTRAKKFVDACFDAPLWNPTDTNAEASAKEKAADGSFSKKPKTDKSTETKPHCPSSTFRRGRISWCRNGNGR